MGSSKINQWERATKLQASALSLVMNGSRSVEAWADHLQSFVFSQLRKALVKYDDPAHHRIDRDQYASVNDVLRSEHFPVRGKGQIEVVYDYLQFDYEISAEDVISIVKGRSDIRFPDKAETDEYHKTYPQERMIDPVISFCGALMKRDGKFDTIALVHADGDGIQLGRVWLYCGWRPDCRFLVVRK